MTRSATEALGLAVRASWRWGIVVTVVLGVALAPGIALIAAMLGPTVGIPAAVATCLYPVSVFVHEFGHALVAVYATRRLGSGLVDGISARSGWMSATIVRPVLPPRADIAATLAGPILGAATGILPSIVSLALFGATTPLTAVLSALFAAHLLALAPGCSDGIELRRALRRKELDR